MTVSTLAALAIAVALTLAGCAYEEKDITVERVARIENCSVYRIFDNITYVYTIVCPHGVGIGK